MSFDDANVIIELLIFCIFVVMCFTRNNLKPAGLRGGVRRKRSLS